MIEPTVGRVVLYTPHEGEGANNGGQPMAATIAYVWGERMVNLSVVDHNGNQFSATSIPLAQDDDIVAPGICEWMDYQKGQAAKTESLEEQFGSGDTEEVVHEAGPDTPAD